MVKKCDLLDDGLLWLINRCLFHRIGYSLGYNSEFGEFFLFGDGIEEWVFSEDLNYKLDLVKYLLGEDAVDKLLNNAGPESQNIIDRNKNEH